MNFDEVTKDIFELSSLEQRCHILSRSIPDISLQSKEFIKNCNLKDRLELASRFIEIDILDTARSDFDILSKYGWFPWVEISNELSDSLSLILMGMNKPALDCQRRALELAGVAGYLSLDTTPKDKVKNWISSKEDTPSFTYSITEFSKSGYPSKVESISSWVKPVKKYYWELCNSVHTKGESYSGRKINNYAGSFNGIAIHRFDEANLYVSCEKFISTVEMIAMITALMNPISLFGLPIDEKFGMNPPISGFLNDFQSDRLKCILPERFREILISIATKDEGCISINEWINSLPDLSDDDLQAQNNEISKLYDKPNS